MKKSIQLAMDSGALGIKIMASGDLAEQNLPELNNTRKAKFHFIPSGPISSTVFTKL